MRQAFDRYIAYKRTLGQSVKDVLSRGAAHILPPLGDLVVAELTAEQLRKWLATWRAAGANAAESRQAAIPKAPTRTRIIRARRRASANRVLTMLKAALNLAYDEGQVADATPGAAS